MIEHISSLLMGMTVPIFIMWITVAVTMLQIREKRQNENIRILEEQILRSNKNINVLVKAINTLNKRIIYLERKIRIDENARMQKEHLPQSNRNE